MKALGVVGLGLAGASLAFGDAPVVVGSWAELQAAFVHKSHHIVVHGTIDGGPTFPTLTFADPDWNDTLVEGEPGGRAELVNLQLKFDGELLPAGTNLHSLTVRNLTFDGRIADLQALPPQVFGTPDKTGINYEGLSFRRCSEVVVEHCTLFDTSDDLMSVTLASDNVRISYCHLFFTPDWVAMDPDPVWNWVGRFQDLAKERLALVVGANSDQDSYAVHHALHVVLDHNWFGPRIRGRPLLRGMVHVFNNLFDNEPDQGDQYNALQIGGGGVVFSEANVFRGTHNSHQVALDQSRDRWGFYERNNQYRGTTGTSEVGVPMTEGPAFDRSRPVDSVDSVEAIVRAQAGPQ